MANFGSFLLMLAGPIARRVFASLGLGLISYAGLVTVAMQVVDMVTASYNEIGGPVLQLLNMIGFGQSIGIVLGAIVARVSYGAIKRIGVLQT